MTIFRFEEEDEYLGQYETGKNAGGGIWGM